jgi:hypothetical protein
MGSGQITVRVNRATYKRAMEIALKGDCTFAAGIDALLAEAEKPKKAPAPAPPPVISLQHMCKLSTVPADAPVMVGVVKSLVAQGYKVI